METKENSISSVDPVACKSCGRVFTNSTILKHLTQTELCKSHYNEDEESSFKAQTKIDINKRKRQTYDPAKRRERYLQQKRMGKVSFFLKIWRGHG